MKTLLECGIIVVLLAIWLLSGKTRTKAGRVTVLLEMLTRADSLKKFDMEVERIQYYGGTLPENLEDLRQAAIARELSAT